jgi:hypothetical protein
LSAAADFVTTLTTVGIIELVEYYDSRFFEKPNHSRPLRKKCLFPANLVWETAPQEPLNFSVRYHAGTYSAAAELIKSTLQRFVNMAFPDFTRCPLPSEDVLYLQPALEQRSMFIKIILSIKGKDQDERAN